MSHRRLVPAITISVLIAIATLATIAGCGGGGGSNPTSSPSPTQSPSPLPSPSTLPSASPTPTPSPSPTVTTVYQTNFSGAVGPEWSNTSTATTPVGARPYLGPFGETAVTLSLANLPAHSKISVLFSLYLIRTWDGNTVTDIIGEHVGPDIWSLQVDGTSLVRTSFSNWDTGIIEPQSYPANFGAGDNPARTGASENNTLGFPAPSPYPYPYMDSVYNLSYSTSHSASTAAITFNGLETVNGAVYSDEGWGIANVVVTVTQ